MTLKFVALALVVVFALAFVAEARRDRVYYYQNKNNKERLVYITDPGRDNTVILEVDNDQLNQDSFYIYGSRLFYIANGQNSQDSIVSMSVSGGTKSTEKKGSQFTCVARSSGGLFYGRQQNGDAIIHDQEVIANDSCTYAATNGDNLFYLDNGNALHRLELSGDKDNEVLLNNVVQFTILGDDLYYATTNTLMVIRNFQDDPLPAAVPILASDNATVTSNIGGFVATNDKVYWCNQQNGGENAAINSANHNGENFERMVDNLNTCGRMAYSAGVPQAAVALFVVVLAVVAALFV